MNFPALTFASFVVVFIGSLIWPMYRTDWIVLSISRDAQLQMPLQKILDEHSSFTSLSFKKKDAEKPCFTVFNANGKLKFLNGGAVDLPREWSGQGRCPEVTITYQSLYRHGFVYFTIDSGLKLASLPTTAAE